MPKTPSKPRVPTFPPKDCAEPSQLSQTPENQGGDLPHVATIELADNAPSSVLERRVKLTDTSMVIDPETTYEEAISLYDFTHVVRERSRWWLGDIVNWMEDHFPDKYTQAIDLTGLTYSRLTTICSVCRKIEPSRRRREASFTWHERIAYLPYQNADHLLDRAIKEKWTNEQFEDSVARAKGEPTKAEKRAAKESKPGSTAAKVAASGKTPQIPEGEKALIWNGYPLSTLNREVYQGPERLPAEESERVAHHHKFPHKEALMNWLEEHGFTRKEGDEKCATESGTPKIASADSQNATFDPTATSNGASVVQPDAAPHQGPTIPTEPPSIENSKPYPIDLEKEYPDPKEDDLQSPVFNSIWGAIKGWDIARMYGLGYAGATGNDVMHVMRALAPAAPPTPSEPPAALEVLLTTLGPQPPLSVPTFDQYLEVLKQRDGAQHAADKAIAERDHLTKERDQMMRVVESVQNTAKETGTPLERAETAILAFNAASAEVDWKAIGEISVFKTKWLGNDKKAGILNRADEVIDLLSGNPPTPRKA